MNLEFKVNEEKNISEKDRLERSKMESVGLIVGSSLC